MNPQEYLELLKTVGGLKMRTRHCWRDGRQESVADHSWRLAMMARLLKGRVDGVDIDKVVTMCLIHDWGEAITGDIPSFFKTEADEETENRAVAALAEMAGGEYRDLFGEMLALETKEARLYKALDKLEAVISHNESDLDTWLELEYKENVVYGTQECSEFSFLKELREIVREQTLDKIGGTANE